MKIIELLIATAPATSNPTDVPKPWYMEILQNQMFLFAAIILLSFMFLGNKGKRGEEKQRTEMLKQLKRGDRIQTIGGIQGAVVRAEESRVEVKVDESSNTKIWFARSAIARVLEADKTTEAK